MHFLSRFLTASLVVLLCQHGAAAQRVTLGGACDVDKDVFGCQGRNYMACDPQSKSMPNRLFRDPFFCPKLRTKQRGRMIIQNGIEVPAPPPSPSPTEEQAPPSSSPSPSRPADPTTPGGSVTPSTSIVLTSPGLSATNTPGPLDPSDPSAGATINPNDGPNSSAARTVGGTATGLIIGIAVGGVVLVTAIVTAGVVYQKRRTSAFPLKDHAHTHINTDKPVFFDGAGALNVASVLEKRYLVAHQYEPAADDEILLRVGDVVRLSLLFNDGWAKGVNETTGHVGLLPCACIQDAHNRDSVITVTKPSEST
ncbi:hypothetical protein BC832DRAFT_601874 [Gaertneriomyces semiglobifer]|nr:hypothetical protein BC832DRAFT_601874 [Gaertneriomyces semiglobifer]